MNHSEQLDKIAPALVRAQSAVTIAVKDSVNPHFRSKYADLGSVWDVARPVLSKNDLAIIQLPSSASDGHVAMRTIILHASGQYVSEEVSVRLQKDDAQGLGSAITYLRRYALAAALGIVADEDDDGNAASEAPKPVAVPAKFSFKPEDKF